MGLARKTTMLNANKANESVWMGSRTPEYHSEYFVTIPIPSRSRSSEVTRSKKSKY